MIASGRVMLVGESNPYGDDPDMALYPDPAGCSGHRLWRVLGVPRACYLSFTRENLCRGDFRMPDACGRAQILKSRVKSEHSSDADVEDRHSLVVLCGIRVKQAFGLHDLATWGHMMDVDGVTWLSLPHPSGRSRAWGVGMWWADGSVARLRETLHAIAPGVPWGATPSPSEVSL